MTTVTGPDGVERCRWSGSAPEFLAYHDTEWGYPIGDDTRLFEKICLEGFQSGLSWRTILNKRESFRAAFAQFDFERVVRFGDQDVERLLQDQGIVRHRGKIAATINNAQRACDAAERHGSLAAFVWQYEPDPAEVPEPQTMSASPTSIRMSKDLKRLGWKFVGPTTVFAFMQAMGLINDHAKRCAMRAKADLARTNFKPPASSTPS
ncbi:MAG: DNA-3-methyladenine glycosylase I [Pseudomonadota bacterium]